mmetsp:Transcript_28745/g.58900  ORF Transcript_28745/g.58900 Transcript_28745/m.58900 type:complete len:87 (-) Transcript_28745:11-271(-)
MPTSTSTSSPTFHILARSHEGHELIVTTVSLVVVDANADDDGAEEDDDDDEEDEEEEVEVVEEEDAEEWCIDEPPCPRWRLPPPSR